MIQIAILASGSGSNAEEIIRFFKNDQRIEVAAIITNRPGAGVLHRALSHGIPTKVFVKKDWHNTDKILSYFRGMEIDFIVLAGYLQKIPGYLISFYSDRIVNIHPALLPSYGGKGMYGMHVHRAVHANKEIYSGITIHLVNENYDEGEIVLQVKCPVHPDDTAEDIQKNVQILEHRYYPLAVKYLASGIAGHPL